MTRSLRFLVIAAILFIANQTPNLTHAQEILFTNNAAYLDRSTNPPTPRVGLNGYLQSVVKNNSTYQVVGMVLSNSYSTYNDVFNPPANAPGTTFGFASNAPFGTLPSSMSWQADLPLPVKAISTDPTNPTYITVSFYLVNKSGSPYNNGVFATYCFMTYVASGKVMTSPAGGPYFAISPPTGLGMDPKDPKNTQVTGASKPEAPTWTFPAPPTPDAHLNGFWEIEKNSSLNSFFA